MNTYARNQQPELMDDPELDPVAHRQALAGLRRINGWSQAAPALWQAIATEVPAGETPRPLRILDLGSGGGDLAIHLAEMAKQVHRPVKISGCDISPTAIDYATEQAASARYTNVFFHRCNVLHEPWPDSQYDVVMCSLFLHHLTPFDAVSLLRRMNAAAEELVLVDDLRRSRLGYWLAWFGCRLLSRSRIVHVDGPRSVEGAYTAREAGDLAVQAGLVNVRIRHRWPQRFLLVARPGGRADGALD